MGSSDQAIKEVKNEESARSSENLAFLYQGLLTIIVRLQAGREQIPEAQSFRARVKKLLLDAEREAKRVGYEADDIKDASLAVVAFLDSVVLHSSEAGHAEWVRQSLADELLEVANAGEVFFDKLDELRGRRNSQDLADVLEVYALCLLLGFEGRYSERQRGELSSVKDKVRRRLEEIEGKPEQLSPTGALPYVPAAPVPPPPPPAYSVRRYAFIASVAVVTAILCFILLKLDLVWEAERASGKLL
jgi:type VI secretion system protein ImpK